MSLARSIFFSLRPPARVLVLPFEFDVAEVVEIDGLPVDGNDTPCCSLPDLLVDPRTMEFVGLTFEVSDKSYLKEMREGASRLDESVVSFAEDGPLALDGVPRGIASINITWKACDDPRYLLANLMNGQWFWWYDARDTSAICPMAGLVAMSCSGLDDECRGHGLSWPEHLEHQTLIVERVKPALR